MKSYWEAGEMCGSHKSLCLISSRINARDLPLQPWRYLHEVAWQLAQQGHAVTIITDGEEDARFEQTRSGLRICRIPSVDRYRWRQNPELQRAVKDSRAEIVLLHVGMTSFVHQRLNSWPGIPTIGIFPGIPYHLSDFRQMGMRNIVNEFGMTWIHMLGALTPRKLLTQPVRQGRLAKLVTLTHTTRVKLIDAGISPESVQAVLPGVDDIWFQSLNNNGHLSQLREQLDFRPEDKVILYFGSPQPLRGLHDLIRALEIAYQSDPNLKLLILSRQREDEYSKENAGLKQLLDHSPVRQNIKVVSGFLNPEKLVEFISLSQAVALPFQLVPADAPLSLLEAQAQGKPVITTRVASLPELVEHGAHYLADPANPASLAEAVLAAAKDIDIERAQKGKGLPKSSPALRRWQQVGAEWSHLVQNL
jgi:glycosyltransferase involved in cell wall biosynthesis